jgi:hypothetical protein
MNAGTKPWPLRLFRSGQADFKKNRGTSLPRAPIEIVLASAASGYLERVQVVGQATGLSQVQNWAVIRQNESTAR